MRKRVFALILLLLVVAAQLPLEAAALGSARELRLAPVSSDENNDIVYREEPQTTVTTRSVLLVVAEILAVLAVCWIAWLLYRRRR